MNSKVDLFIKKAKNWNEEIATLRKILLSTKLEEDFKWGLPCYTHNGSNIVIIQAFKAYMGLMFFNGASLKDSKKLLINNGPNSQSTKRLAFASVADVKKLSTTIKAYVKEAINVEDTGKIIKVERAPLAVPTELKKVFTAKPKVKKAFEGLTPGRQRAYILFFAAAKQSATRTSRIEKFLPKILQGKGMLD